MASLNSLPEGYETCLSVDLKKDKRLAVGINLAAVVIAAFMVVFILWRKKVSPGHEILRRR